MKIIVCLKQVPDTNDVEINSATGTMIRENISAIINPADRNALEEALIVKEKTSGSVTALSMGPLTAEAALREALALGADEAFLLSDKLFGGADTLATALTLSLAVKKISGFDLIFCGHQTSDGNTAHVGPSLAELLDLPQITCVKKIISFDKHTVTVERELEDGYEVVECSLPALLTAVRELNMPKLPTLDGIFTAFNEKTVTVWSKDDLLKDAEAFGTNGSCTKVVKTFNAPQKSPGKILTGEVKNAVKTIVKELMEKHAL